MENPKEVFEMKHYIAVVAVLLAISMSVLDGTIMNIALPTLSKDFGLMPSNSIWIVNGYQLVITMTLLIFASLGEIHGYRKVFTIGILVFTIGSLASALSRSFEMLMVARAVQGLGAASVMAVNTALIRIIYPPQFLGRGMGINAMVISVSAAAGPSIAGSILSFASWHWLFVINVPLGILAFIIGYKLLPQNPPSTISRRFDGLGAVASALTMGLLIFFLDGFSHDDRGSFNWITLAFFLIIGTFYIRREIRTDAPILPVDLMRIPMFSLSTATSIASFGAQMIALLALPFFLQNALHFSPVMIGVMLTAWPIATIVAAPVSGILVERINPGLLGTVGMIIFAGGLYLLFLLPDTASEWSIIWRLMICGFGFGFFQTPNNVAIVSSAPKQRSGAASGMLGIARMLGQTIGAAIAAMMFHAFADVKGSREALLAAIACAVVAAIVSSMRMTQKLPKTE